MSSYKTRLDELDANRPGDYQQSQQVNEAQAALKDYEGKKPGAYSSKYQSQLDDLLGQITNRKGFEYDFNQDALYQMYKDQYTEQGRQAAANAAASASALTGGYGNSYAASAAAQANQQYLTQLNDKIPDLASLALARYQQEGNDLLSKYGVVQGADAVDYSRYQDDLTDYYNYLNYLNSRENTLYNRDYTAWGDKINRYNTDRDYLYTGYRGDVADEQWAKELAEQQRQYNESLAENRRQFDANLAWSREQAAQQLAAQQAAATYSAGSGRSTGSSSRSSRSSSTSKKSSSTPKYTYTNQLAQQVAYDRTVAANKAANSKLPANAPLSTKGKAEQALQQGAALGMTGAQAYNALTKQYPGLKESEKDALLKKYYN